MANIGNSFAEEIRRKAIQVVISLTSGAYQTSLVSYFTHRDLFPALVKYIQDADTLIRISEPLLLLGLLANHNKFEFRNPYRLRLEDYLNESTIQKAIQGLGAGCARCRDGYIAIQDDAKEGWTLSSTLKYIGLGVLAPSRSSTPVPNVEDRKEQFSALPDPTAAILLSAYDFTAANKLFAYTLLSLPSSSSSSEPPFASFLSLTSYILHHAYRSPRASLYGLLNLLTLRFLIEDPSLASKLFSTSSPLQVRLCRQRQPFLPSTSTHRPPAAAILDLTIDYITHNLRRRLDVPVYAAALTLIHRLLCHLSITRTKFPYHWPLLWQTLLSLLRFLTTYSSTLISNPDLPSLLHPFLLTLILPISNGEAFLPSSHNNNNNPLDDLLYKLIESAHLLPRFQTSFSIFLSPSNTTTTTTQSALTALQ
ncbi:MAG: hypothetical protein Q9190_007998, partial [Brigantiaea leucoxantha]